MRTIFATLTLLTLTATSTLAQQVRQAPPGPGYQKVSKLVPLPDFIPGLGTLYVDPKTLPAGPFLAYDHQGRLVSTIYMIPMKSMEVQVKFADLAAPGGVVDHVNLTLTPGILAFRTRIITSCFGTCRSSGNRAFCEIGPKSKGADRAIEGRGVPTRMARLDGRGRNQCGGARARWGADVRRKLSQAQARYQTVPNGQQRCGICLQFRPPNSCDLVDGPIDPTGWCQFFAARDDAH